MNEQTSSPATPAKGKAIAPYTQNRELSWLTFDERVLDQGADETVPLLQRLNFISIFWSNLQEFFMVRVGSLTDLALVKKPIIDSKSGMTPAEQIAAIHKRCHQLYPIQERTYEDVRALLAEQGVVNVRPKDLSADQQKFLADYVHGNVIPFLSPQIINSRHPFPHLENGALYVIVRLDEQGAKKTASKGGKIDKAALKEAKKEKNLGAEGATLGLIPLPHQCERVISLPGDGFQFILLEHAIEMVADQIFSMYKVKHTNVICVTRNADLDSSESGDEVDDDYREHMKRILKKRGRLAPVRLESERPLSSTLQEILTARLELDSYQLYYTSVPLDMSYTFGLASKVSKEQRAALTDKPFSPQWPACFDRKRRIMDQVVEKREVLLSYPYESMDPFVQLLREASADPTVVSIKITLYRLASQSNLAEALIAAAENGKEVTALFELRARFDENNNIEWSQRFEQAGCNVIYGFRDFKVHSKICCITRQTSNGIQHITQLGTGNYNEKTARLYTDLSFITTDEALGRDAMTFFRNMSLENVSTDYGTMWVAPLQIKPMILAGIEQQIDLARMGEPCGLFFKTNSVTDKVVIDKLAQASQEGVPITLFVRGISCIVPGVAGFTDNVRVVSIVGQLLEHSRIYGFGPRDAMSIYLSSADLMTRNMDKRVEIAWPILGDALRAQVLDYLDICMRDTAKLRQLLPDGTYTALGAFATPDQQGEMNLFNSQEYLIERAYKHNEEALANAKARLATTLSFVEEGQANIEEQAGVTASVVTAMPQGKRQADASEADKAKRPQVDAQGKPSQKAASAPAEAEPAAAVEAEATVGKGEGAAAAEALQPGTADKDELQMVAEAISALHATAQDEEPCAADAQKAGASEAGDPAMGDAAPTFSEPQATPATAGSPAVAEPQAATLQADQAAATAKRTPAVEPTEVLDPVSGGQPAATQIVPTETPQGAERKPGLLVRILSIFARKR